LDSLIFFKKILPRLARFHLARLGAPVHSTPMTITHSVTFACQSKCKTCGIGNRYREDPALGEQDLTLDEIEKIYQSIGDIYFFNVSGGEPYLREDLPEIIELAMRYLRPNVVHIPTNALMPERIQEQSLRIIEIIRKYDPGVSFSVKPSIDGLGEAHDGIRGVKGNFEKLLKTIELLKAAERTFDRFHLELGTVVSVFNRDQLEQIEDFVHGLGVQTYRNEIAECREEFFNLDDEITPTAEQYEQLMDQFKRKITCHIKAKKSLTRMIEAIRLVYYDLVPDIMRRKTQVIPCFGGISNIHLNHDGALWPCCMMGYSHPLGHFRDETCGYDFRRLMSSAAAKETLQYIKDKKCYCVLANQSLSNIMLSPAYFLKTVYHYLKFRL
jgi:MoaA/NifB/PqqE/SkfB family radical SAM enzyme